MQQAYVLAYTRLQQFADGARFSTWLLRIGINEALQRLRGTTGAGLGWRLTRSRRSPPCTTCNPGNAPRPRAAEPPARAAGGRGSPTRTGRCFVLREVQQLSTAEVAEVLELTPDNVKQRLSRAKAMLRDALEQRTGESIAELYPFEAPRCDRVVANVLARLARPG